MPLETLKCENCARNAWGRGSSKNFSLFDFPANKERKQLWNSTMNRYILLYGFRGQNH